ncbi:MAG: Paraquat-inducible protein B [uncultured Sulfurovum sp.]|uniref:Paraquat-inducible protein B n=1 Tax=uncultured Sulfurovum sp. TaxID=269237 RepID=A0A6S6TLD5_9BACT|nr:MAG: Paraquat-inducible protein B [uncultured Sulfurovum sp.]
MPLNKYNSPRIKESKGIQLLTTIWMVPFIALVIALWLAYQYYSKVGPLVNIEFKTNAGLVAKQSHVKLRNVIVGTVESVALSETGDGVTVQVRMNKNVSKYLNKSAKFWIVHPDVDSSGITGLDTLLSGSYIELKALKDEKTKKNFIGLEEAPPEDMKGKTFLLSAPKSYHLKKGSNVYYRMIKVGKVQHVGIAPDGTKINFVIFIHEKYIQYINKNSQFYTTSSVSVDISKGKLDLNVASLSQIAKGGISIYTPTQSFQQDAHLTLKKSHIFPLYKNLNQMKAKHLMRGIHDKAYKFVFNESISQLEIGSSIEFNGFQVGHVIDISSHFNTKSRTIESEVYAIIHTQGFSHNSSAKEGEKIIECLVNDGLKARLHSVIPVIGTKFIDLVFDNNKSAKLSMENGFNLFPTIKMQEQSNILHEIEEVVSKIKELKLEKLLASATRIFEHNEKPVNEILTNLKKTIKVVNTTLNTYTKTAKNINTITEQESLKQLPATLETTLNELTRTLEQVKTLSQDYNANSKFSAQLALTMKELTQTAESVGKVSKTLERKSNALILGDN